MTTQAPTPVPKGIHQYAFPTRVKFGAGCRRGLAEALRAAAVRRPVIVTDRGLADMPFIGEMAAQLREAGYETTVFSGIWGNPVKAQVDEGARAAREAKADAVIAVGGGAALDVGKAIALLVNHEGDIFDYVADAPDRRPIDRPMPFLVAVPTTAGTGSEVGRAAVVSEDETHVKRILVHARLLPALVLADPELTLGLPANMTAATGMDAVTHLTEAFLSQGFHPMADGVALEGMRLVSESLESAVRFAGGKSGPTDEHLDARGKMLIAALMGAVAFQKGLGLTHSCAHALSTVCDLHHGTANAILIPYCMEYNLPAARERFERLAAAVGAEDRSAEGFVRWLLRLNDRIGMPRTLAEAGVREEHLERLVPTAFKDVCHPEGPRPVTEEDFRRIYLNAIHGKLETSGT